MPTAIASPPAPTKPRRPLAVPPPLWQRAAARTAVAAGAFCVVLALALAIEHFRHKTATHPLDHPKVVELKDELGRQPINDQLQKDIRALDLQLRLAHDRYLTHIRRAQWLLLGGMAVFLAALQATVWRKKIARPGKQLKLPGWQARETLRSTAAVVVLGMLTGTFAWWLTASSDTRLTSDLAKPVDSTASSLAQTVKTAMPATPFPTPEEVARNWGRFRGPGGAGVSASTNLPLTCNVQTGDGLLWKTRVPGPDFNSPVVWENHVFLTTATARRREVCCYDTTTGKLLWQKPVENVPGGGALIELPELSGGFACPTAATDGRRVYAMFANGDLAAFDFDGAPMWSKSFAPLKNEYGHAASLDLWQDRLIVQLDHGDFDEKVSKLVALNAADGSVVWEKARETHGTWSTPVTVEAGGKPQIITLGNPHVMAYSAVDGAELWRVEGIDGEITPSPILAGGLVLAPSPSTKLIAIRPDGLGDVTKTHVAWEREEGIPDITSPVSDGRHVYLLTTFGTLTCYELNSGDKLWEQELEHEFRASPSLAGDRLYLISGKGVLIVALAGPAFKELARSELGEEVSASPAFADGRLLIRGKQHLFCLANQNP